MEMGSEQFGPFAIDPAWRRRGPTAVPRLADGVPAAPLPEPAPAEPERTAEATPEWTPEPIRDEVPVSFTPLPIPPIPGPLTRPSPESTPVAVAFETVLWPQSEAEAEVVAPAVVFPPKPEEVPGPRPFKPDPVPVPAAARSAERRGFGVDAIIPYLAALVGLIALGGAVYLDQQNQLRLAGMATELSTLRAAVDAANRPAPPVRMTPPSTVEPELDAARAELLALQERVAALEKNALSGLPMPSPASGDAAIDETGSVPEEAAAGDPDVVGETKLADGPTTDCIPVGTRFVAIPGDSYPICRTTETIRVKDVSIEGVLLNSGKLVPSGGTAALKFGTCALNVVTADDGFADMKVTCS